MTRCVAIFCQLTTGEWQVMFHATTLLCERYSSTVIITLNCDTVMGTKLRENLQLKRSLKLTMISSTVIESLFN